MANRVPAPRSPPWQVVPLARFVREELGDARREAGRGLGRTVAL